MTDTVLKLSQEASMLDSQAEDLNAFVMNIKIPQAKKPRFPDSSYFQIHFEYLEMEMQENRHCLESLQKQMRELQALLMQITVVEKQR